MHAHIVSGYGIHEQLVNNQVGAATLVQHRHALTRIVMLLPCLANTCFVSGHQIALRCAEPRQWHRVRTKRGVPILRQIPHVASVFDTTENVRVPLLRALEAVGHDQVECHSLVGKQDRGDLLSNLGHGLGLQCERRYLPLFLVHNSVDNDPPVTPNGEALGRAAARAVCLPKRAEIHELRRLEVKNALIDEKLGRTVGGDVNMCSLPLLSSAAAHASRRIVQPS
mmetsp:Transcript_65707/g.174125  ORF Transcript_65707/g.174125 Transcript_65707/m.174125 type:complete len:225 (+) Transcript_65707:737-1411(+)